MTARLGALADSDERDAAPTQRLLSLSLQIRTRLEGGAVNEAAITTGVVNPLPQRGNANAPMTAAPTS